MCIWFDCLFIFVSWSVDICEDSVVLPSGILAVISFDIITGAIVGLACFARCIFAPESVIAIMLLLRLLGRVSIKFIKMVLGILIFMLLSIVPNYHSCPFSISPGLFLVGFFLVACFLRGSGFTLVSIVTPENPTVVHPLGTCLVGLRRCWYLQLRLHGFHDHSHLYQLCHNF